MEKDCPARASPRTRAVRMGVGQTDHLCQRMILWLWQLYHYVPLVKIMCSSRCQTQPSLLGLVQTKHPQELTRDLMMDCSSGLNRLHNDTFSGG
jgi:hypothetical protein